MASLVPRPNFFTYAMQQTDAKSLSLKMRLNLVLIVGRSGHNRLFVGCELCECIVSLVVVRQTILH